MSNQPFSLRERIVASLRDFVARLAMRFCTPILLYWVDPEAWEEFLNYGESPTQLLAMYKDALERISDLGAGDEPSNVDMAIEMQCLAQDALNGELEPLGAGKA